MIVPLVIHPVFCEGMVSFVAMGEQGYCLILDSWRHTMVEMMRLVVCVDEKQQ